MCSLNNNKSIFGLFLFLFVIASVCSQNTDPYNQLATHWFNKCNNQTKGNTALFDRLYAHGVEFKRYLKYAFQFIPEEKKNFCNSERITLLNKMKELSDDMKPCLANNEQYMSEFVYTSFREFLHFLCHNDAEHINSFFSPNAAECRKKLFDTDSNDALSPCLSRIIKPASGHPTKKELCTDLARVKTCFSEVLSSQCPSYGAYKKLNEEFFKYVVNTPCSACASYLNTLLLTLSLLAYWFTR